MAKAKPEYCSEICLSFLFSNVLFGGGKIWSTIPLGYFHSIKNIAVILGIWLSGNLIDYHVPQVVNFPNAYTTSIIGAGLF